MQALFHNGNQHASADRDPDLSLDRVLAGVQERLEAQALLDPLAERLHPSALAAQLADEFGLKAKVVRQKSDALADLVPDHDTAHRCRVAVAGHIGTGGRVSVQGRSSAEYGVLPNVDIFCQTIKFKLYGL